jgi:inosose dehydratase
MMTNITFEQGVSEMDLTGFACCEMGDSLPGELFVANSLFSSYLTTLPYEEEVSAFLRHRDCLHGLGAKVIAVSEQGHSVQRQSDIPAFVGKHHNTLAEWERLFDGLNRLGSLALEKGMQLVYHHHMGTCVQTEAEIDELMENTDPEKVSLLYDTGHLVCSGENHLRILRNHLTRIKHVHLRDVRLKVRERMIKENMSFLAGVRAGLFTVPGAGDIDFGPIIKILNRGRRHW